MSQEVRDGSPSAAVEHASVESTLHGGDESMPDSRHDWGHLLDRTSPNKAWRIQDEGVA